MKTMANAVNQRILVLAAVIACLLSTSTIIHTVCAQSVGSPDNSQLFDGPYIQVYPPVDLPPNQHSCFPQNSSTGTCPLFFGLIQAFGGDFSSSNVIPGVQLALDQINADPELLPGYTLHYTLIDSQCDRTVGLDAMASQLINSPTKIGIIGAGCSLATEPTAEVSHYFNITHISCISSSSELANRNRFRYYFQVLASEDRLAFGFFQIIKEFGWQQVGIITQDENIFTASTQLLRDLLADQTNVTVTETLFDSREGIRSLPDPDNPFGVGSDADIRIFVLSMYEGHARRLLCQASRTGVSYPQYLFLTYAWFTSEWWVGSEKEQEALLREYDGCTVEQRARVAQYTLGVIFSEFLSDNSTVIDSGINGTSYHEFTDIYFRDSPLNFTRLQPDYSQQCYDGTWTFARGLNQVVQELQNNQSLGDQLARFNPTLNLQPGEEFGLQHFTYNNIEILDIVFKAIEGTNFTGITGPLKFNQSDGVRVIDVIRVFSHQLNFDGAPLRRVHVADVNFANRSNIQFSFVEGITESFLWGDEGRPIDGIPLMKPATVSLALTVILILLASGGIIFAIVCLVFNVVFRKRKLIRLSSPKLNLIIGIGAIVLYIDVYLFVIPTTNQTALEVFCNITPWLTALGYSLCYGTMLAKMFRVYYIFNNITPQRKRAIHDWMLALGVLLLVMIDLLILITYTAVEGARGNLSAQRVPSSEDVTEEARRIVTKYFIFICDSKARDITLGILYGYKALLQVIALVFTLSIRKVKIKGLNDAKYIAAAIYITSIVTVVIIVAIYALQDLINVFAALLGGGFFIGTTGILILVFIPKMVNLYRDPTGIKVFTSKSELQSTAPRTNEIHSKDETIARLRAKLKEYEDKYNETPNNGLINGGNDINVKPSDAPLPESSATTSVKFTDITYKSSDGRRFGCMEKDRNHCSK